MHFSVFGLDLITFDLVHIKKNNKMLVILMSLLIKNYVALDEMEHELSPLLRHR